MTGDRRSIPRRSVLRTTAVVGAGSLAGCFDWSSEEGSTEPNDRPTSNLERPSGPYDAPRLSGPLSERPEKGSAPGQEYFVTHPPEQGTLYVWIGNDWHAMGVSGPDGGFQRTNGVRQAAQFATDGHGTKDDPWIVDSSVVPAGGHVSFEPGQFRASGLKTPSDGDYENDAVYFSGAGVRATVLNAAPKDGSVITFQSVESGNFGGVSDMSVLGTFPNGTRSSGHLIEGDGNIIDTVYENLIVRYSWGDGMRLAGSTSGTRIRNCWIENNRGWNVHLGTGTRLKIDNCHLISAKKGGIYSNNSTSQFSNLSLYNCSPGIELQGVNNAITNVYAEGTADGAVFRERSVSGNVVSNATVKDSQHAVVSGASQSQYSTIRATNIGGSVVRLTGSNTVVDGLAVDGFGTKKQSAPAIRLDGTEHHVSNVRLGGADGSRVSARIAGAKNVLSNVVCQGGRSWQLRVEDGAVETVLSNVQGLTRDGLRDNGTRTLFNGQATNSGDPSASGEWNGHADYAHATGALVWNTAVSPWIGYRADGAGNWSRVTSGL
ncbi:right-handed parallel beta-helix repeat-containing protein [Halocatena halophila]|uniref:right-handed parallel beta-helix repeat-containing protein n=1 Tax=Halocatena halophila TaxID=2814576 RepID=UPI002ED61C45